MTQLAKFKREQQPSFPLRRAFPALVRLQGQAERSGEGRMREEGWGEASRAACLTLSKKWIFWIPIILCRIHKIPFAAGKHAALL